MSEISIRFAVVEDVPVILSFIKSLAEYEHLSDEAVATESDISKTLFGEDPQAEVLIASLDGQNVGFSLFFHNYSTFLGHHNIYLEDLFVLPEFRGRGVGTSLLRHLAGIAVRSGCRRLDWAVLNWNESAIEVYRSIGAEPMSDWTSYRLSGDALRKFAGVE